MSEVKTNYHEIKASMSESRKEWIRGQQFVAKQSFDRNPYAYTIAEVSTDKTIIEEEREDIYYED